MITNTFPTEQREYARQHRKRAPLAGIRVFTFIALIALLPTVSVCSQAVTETDKPPVTKVFINLNGDKNLAHRLRTLIDAEFGDAGWVIVNTANDADVTITGQVTMENTKQTLQLGVVRIKSLTNDTGVTIDHCSNLSDGDGGELFENSANSVSKLIKERYPKIKTVKLEGDSDMSLSDTFGNDLPAALDSLGLTLVSSGTADLVLRIDLQRKEIPIEATIVEYELTAITRDNKRLINQTGHGKLAAKLTGSPPSACPQRFMDLEWLYRADPLLAASREFVRDLRTRRRVRGKSELPRKTTRSNQERTVWHKQAA